MTPILEQQTREGFEWCGKEEATQEERECWLCSESDPTERFFCDMCQGHGTIEVICCEYHSAVDAGMRRSE